MKSSSIYKRITFRNLKGRFKRNEPLAAHTTFRIGGPAEYFFHPRNRDDLRNVIRQARHYKLGVRVIGSGSNLLISDKGVRGIVVKLDSPCFRRISRKDRCLEAGSGALLATLVRKAYRSGLGGCEFLYGIPGTVGGALVMNAGAWGKNIAGIVEKVTVMHYNGNVNIYERDDISFFYRGCGLRNVIVLSVLLKTRRRSKRLIKRELADYRARRFNAQEICSGSAGCIFKNPAAAAAGYLIESCGLKGARSAGAAVSLKHANFIINRDHARCGDVVRLMSRIRRQVKKSFGIRLEPEVKLWK